MEMQDLETLGIIKFDILGVAMLDKVMAVSTLLKNGGSYE
jgi:DNA polymerase III alpha subunit